MCFKSGTLLCHNPPKTYKSAHFTYIFVAKQLPVKHLLQQFMFKNLAIDPIIGFDYLVSAKDKEVTLSHRKEVLSSLAPSVMDMQGNSISSDLSIGTNGIASIKIHNMLTTQRLLCGKDADAIASEIRTARTNPNIMGLVLDMRTGGGEVTATQIIANELEGFNKPLVGYVNGYAASGGYWLLSYCDEIVMGGNMAQVGSIGVVQHFDKQIIELIKENDISIYADGSEEKDDILKSVLGEDFDYIKKESLNPVRAEFVRIVKRGRKSVSDEALKGKMYPAKKAIKLGLADRIGTFQTAINRVININRAKARQARAQNALANV